ncbi:MAG: hypothetical protein WCI52_00015 [bacterium]
MLDEKNNTIDSEEKKKGGVVSSDDSVEEANLYISRQPSFKDLENQVKQLKNDIDNSKKDLIIMLGIFASFITFTSVDFQLLRNIPSVGDYISLTFLLLSSMLIFVFALKNFITEELDWSFFKKPLFLVIIILVFLSLITYTLPRILILN